MPNLVTTTIDYVAVELRQVVYGDGLLKFAGVATVLAGTILARDTSDNTLIPYVIGGSTNGNGIPCAVLPNDVTSTGAGNIAIRAIISGSVNRNRLIVNADGTGVNITKQIEDQLRARSIVPEVVDQIAS